MKTATEKITQILLIETSIYLENNIERYMRWCQNLSQKFDVPLQNIIANTAIANYYRVEFNKLENKFMNEAIPLYGKVRYTTMRTMYCETVIDIFNFFPKPLIEDAKKITIINPPINSN